MLLLQRFFLLPVDLDLQVLYSELIYNCSPLGRMFCIVCTKMIQIQEPEIPEFKPFLKKHTA